MGKGISFWTTQLYSVSVSILRNTQLHRPAIIQICIISHYIILNYFIKWRFCSQKIISRRNFQNTYFHFVHTYLAFFMPQVNMHRLLNIIYIITLKINGNMLVNSCKVLHKYCLLSFSYTVFCVKLYSLNLSQTGDCIKYFYLAHELQSLCKYRHEISLIWWYRVFPLLSHWSQQPLSKITLLYWGHYEGYRPLSAGVFYFLFWVKMDNLLPDSPYCVELLPHTSANSPYVQVWHLIQVAFKLQRAA
jgi:hypothetical protein